MVVGLKLSKKDLKEILDFIKLEGRDASGNTERKIESFILFIGEKFSRISCITDDQSISFLVKIRAELLGEKGEIPIEIEKIDEVIKRFKDKDEIEIYYDTEDNLNALTILRRKPKLAVTYETIDIVNVISTFRKDMPIKFEAEIPTFFDINKNADVKFDVMIEIDGNKVKDSIDDSKISESYDYYPVAIKNDVLEITISDQKDIVKVEREIETKIIKHFTEINNIISKFGSSFTNLFNSLNGQYRFYLSNDSPLYLIKNSKSYSIEAFLLNAIVVTTGESDETDDSYIEEKVD